MSSPFLHTRNAGPCVGFDQYSGQKWVYPNNMPVRPYQMSSVQKSLFTNAMIVLPTGFGKTFIAAVVMYNFYRWYPSGKIIFVAPTRPLVSQQIVECKKISGIPPSDCVELTGTTPANKRVAYWEEKRVFFATPQVIENDLHNSLVPSTAVRLIIFDEAHRAQGDYSYVKIARQLHNENRDGFRIVALSATPGSDMEKVRQVISNLYIGDILFRSESSIDLLPFKNEKTSKAWTVELNGRHQNIVKKFKEVADPIFGELIKTGLVWGRSVETIPKFCIVKLMNQITSNNLPPGNHNRGRLISICSTCIVLSQMFELLTIYGLRTFYSCLQEKLETCKGSLKTLVSGPRFASMLLDIEIMFGSYVTPNHEQKTDMDLTIGHPKLGALKDILTKHFECGKENTRVMVFTRYVTSVYDIVQTLKTYEPLFKPSAFVGQKGMKQREQIQLVEDFKRGVFNILVATQVAEEGLDIGEVDLIVCYDTSSSPISNVQRRGRTGRKRSGDVQTLLTKGYEERKLGKAGESRRKVEEQLYNRDNYITYCYKNAPRMIPAGLEPTCLKLMITPVEEEPEPKPKASKRPLPSASEATNLKHMKGSECKFIKASECKFMKASDDFFDDPFDD